MSPPIVADTGGLLRGLASTRDGNPSFPEYEKILTSASLVIVSGLVLAEVDYFLRENRVAMRKLVAESFQRATRFEYELPYPPTSFGPATSTPDSGRSTDTGARAIAMTPVELEFRGTTGLSGRAARATQPRRLPAPR